MNCPKCGQAMDLFEKDTSSGRDMRTYLCRPCHEYVDADNGIALWKAISDAREEDTPSKPPSTAKDEPPHKAPGSANG